MEQLNLDRLREALKSFAGAELQGPFEVRRWRPDGAITGFIVRRDWEGIPSWERQRQLHDFLEAHFGAQAGDVGLLFTFTPEEYEAWAEDQLAPL